MVAESARQYGGLLGMNILHLAVVLFLAVKCNLGEALLTCPYLSVEWWENKPYVFKNSAGELDGVLPLLFRQAGRHCCNKLEVTWAKKFDTYKEAHDVVLQINPGSTKNSSAVDIWLPFSLLNADNVTEFEILTSTQLVMMVVETRLDKLIIVYQGFKSISPQILMTMILTILFGILMWLAETRSNSQFPAPFPRGAWHGFWWAIVTVTTVGYGDKSPRTFFGRLIGIVWMITGLVLFPVLTAEVTSILTDTSYSLVLKKAGVLRNSKEIKTAVDQGAFVHECDSYDHCLKMLEDGSIEVMLVDVHVAAWLPQAELYLVKKGTISAKISINVITRKTDQFKFRDFHECIKKNTSLVTESIKNIQGAAKLSDSKGVIFSSGTKDIALILGGFVAAIYAIVFVVDSLIRYKRKKNKIGDFREGVFMDKTVIKNGTEHEMREIDNPVENLKQLIKKQRLQLSELQQSIEELERKIES